MVSPLNLEVGMYSGVAARAAELIKHSENDQNWVGNVFHRRVRVMGHGLWRAYSQVASRLAICEITDKVQDGGRPLWSPQPHTC